MAVWFQACSNCPSFSIATNPSVATMQAPVSLSFYLYPMLFTSLPATPSFILAAAMNSESMGAATAGESPSVSVVQMPIVQSVVFPQ